MLLCLIPFFYSEMGNRIEDLVDPVEAICFRFVVYYQKNCTTLSPRMKIKINAEDKQSSLRFRFFLASVSVAFGFASSKEV